MKIKNKYIKPFILIVYGCFNIELLQFLIGVVYGVHTSKQSLYRILIILTLCFILIEGGIHAIRYRKLKKITTNTIAMYFTCTTAYSVFSFMIIEQLIKGTNTLMYAAFIFILMMCIGYSRKKISQMLEKHKKNSV